MTTEDFIEYIDTHEKSETIKKDIHNITNNILKQYGTPPEGESFTFVAILTIDKFYCEVRIHLTRKGEKVDIGLTLLRELTEDEFLDQFNETRAQSKSYIYPVPGSEQQERSEIDLPKGQTGEVDNPEERRAEDIGS